MSLNTPLHRDENVYPAKARLFIVGYASSHLQGIERLITREADDNLTIGAVRLLSLEIPTFQNYL